ncbi:hypothetical protein Acr_00g0033510 [Actinidia rufa]|uniref:Uncharacterized protein n=1 Tax=Actinidia rufa TaxID=165716 RepID=A0A7J0DFM9_9ERIC|nr:hypothetical protein Acr_00g0033510 [Actinidia rufa]
MHYFCLFMEGGPMQLDEIPSVSKDVFHACNNIKAWIDHRELETPIYGLSLFKVQVEHTGQNKMCCCCWKEGYCSEISTRGDKLGTRSFWRRCLHVYEFIPLGSLDDHPLQGIGRHYGMVVRTWTHLLL